MLRQFLPSVRSTVIRRTMRKAQDEEKLTMLRSTLEEAFERFKVCRISS
jgi:hypothetical protein